MTDMEPILQSRLGPTALSDPVMGRLPGVQPLDPETWLLRDDAFGAQMALRDQLISDARDKVLMIDPGADEPAQELLENLTGAIQRDPDYILSGNSKAPERVIRPDGVSVEIDHSDPLATAGRLVQEDLCILQKLGGNHVLTGAILCFPANWTLAEKFMRPLSMIHRTVAPYSDDIARRVDRLFDGIRPGRALWRTNLNFEEDPRLFSPKPETHVAAVRARTAPYLRSERQCILRLEKSDAVVFSIHTTIVRREDLSGAQVRALEGFQTPS